jgi:vacuolar-type H+-ATPase subunit E/Vma4
LAAGMTIASVAAGILNVAMRLIPFVGLALGIAAVVTGIVTLGSEANKTKPYVDMYGGAIRKSGDDAIWAANAYGIAADAAIELAAATNVANATSQAYDNAEQFRMERMRDRAAAAAAAARAALPDLSALLNAMNAVNSGGSGTVVDHAAAAAAAAAQAAAQARAERIAAREKALLEKRKAAFKSFRDSVKSLFGQIKDSIMSGFSLPDLGNSVNSITRNIAKLLERTKSFAKNITQLSGLGLNSTLLQQVIQAGPMGGGQLAAALVGGGSAFISQLNSAYGEFGGLASGIAQTATTQAFANRRTVNNYSIAVTGGVATSADVGRAVVNAIASYERQSGAAWRA